MCSESPKATPSKNAPNMAWIPSHSVNAAARKQKANESDKTPPGQANFLLTQGSTLLIMILPKVNMKKVKSSVIPMVWNRVRLLPLPINDKITEKINHPIMSLTMAEATMMKAVSPLEYHWFKFSVPVGGEMC